VNHSSAVEAEAKGGVVCSSQSYKVTLVIYNLKVSVTSLIRGFVLAFWLVHTISAAVEKVKQLCLRLFNLCIHCAREAQRLSGKIYQGSSMFPHKPADNNYRYFLALCR